MLIKTYSDWEKKQKNKKTPSPSDIFF
jgi:hypothetical protein